MAHLESKEAKCPTPKDLLNNGDQTFMIGFAYKSLSAARTKADKSSIASFILSDSVEGESKDIGSMHTAIVNQIARYGHPFARPALLLSGGETSVTLGEGSGRGEEIRSSFSRFYLMWTVFSNICFSGRY